MSSVVYVVSEIGHRAQYARHFADLLSMDVTIAAPSARTFKQLLGPQSLLLATIDDHLLSGALLCALRGILGRKTVGLQIRSMALLSPATRAQRLRQLIFRCLRLIPNTRILSILPHEFAPGLKAVSKGSVLDPQWWDQLESHPPEVPSPPDSELAQQVRSLAGGRRVIVFLGYADRAKGVIEFCKLARADQAAGFNSFFVLAGPVANDLKDDVEAIGATGGLLASRFISDQELLSLYGAADVVWACYDPIYDQASGIAGRGAQFGVPVLVRQGSLLERMLCGMGIRHVPTAFGQSEETARLIQAELVRQGSAAGGRATPDIGRLYQYRDEAIQAIRLALR